MSDLNQPGNKKQPKNKKEFVAKVGKKLVKEHGKKKYYKPEEVKKAHEKAKKEENDSWFDFEEAIFWAMSFFSSHEEFDEYQEKEESTYDYVDLKSEIIRGVAETSDTDSDSWSDFFDVDIDLSWLDISDSVGDVFEGVADFVAGIFDGL